MTNYNLSAFYYFLLFPCSMKPRHMFHSPFILSLLSSVRSPLSSSSRTAVKSSGGGKVPEGKVNRKIHCIYHLTPYLT